jgi:hypothetical protein
MKPSLSVTVGTRFYSDVYLALRKSAQQDGRNPSAQLRWLVAEALRQRGLLPPVSGEGAA